MPVRIRLAGNEAERETAGRSHHPPDAEVRHLRGAERDQTGGGGADVVDAEIEVDRDRAIDALDVGVHVADPADAGS